MIPGTHDDGGDDAAERKREVYSYVCLPVTHPCPVTCHTSVTLLTQANRVRKQRERQNKKAEAAIPLGLPPTGLHTEPPPHVDPALHTQHQWTQFLQWQQWMSQHPHMGHAPLPALGWTPAPHVPSHPGGLSPSPNTQSQGSTP